MAEDSTGRRIGTVVLVADDDPTCRAVLCSALTAWGYRCLEACDGHEAWNLLQRHQGIRLAVVNWMMPRMDGLSLCKLLEVARPGEVGVIMMAGKDYVEELSQRLSLRPLAYVSKPLDLFRLRSVLSQAVSTNCCIA